MKSPHINDKCSDSGRAKDFVGLHEQVQTSVNLLDSLQSFLSTFQTDLAAVSGQISELQDRSKDIENRLKSRRVRQPLFLETVPKLSRKLNDLSLVSYPTLLYHLPSQP